MVDARFARQSALSARRTAAASLLPPPETRPDRNALRDVDANLARTARCVRGRGVAARAARLSAPVGSRVTWSQRERDSRSARAGDDLTVNVVEQADGNNERIEQMVSIRAAPDDAQTEIDLGRGCDAQLRSQTVMRSSTVSWSHVVGTTRR